MIVQKYVGKDLANNLDSLVLGSQNLANFDDVASLSDETGGDKVDVVGNSPFLDIVDILLGEGRKVDDHTGKVHVFAFADGAIVLDTAGDFSSGDIASQDGQNEGTIGDQNGLPRVDRGGKSRIRASQLVRVSLEGVIGGKGQRLTLDKADLLGSVGKETRADFGSLGIEQDGCFDSK